VLDPKYLIACSAEGQALSRPDHCGSGVAAATNPDAAIKKTLVCEISFFIGELDLQPGKKDDAARLFHQATDGCPEYLITYEGAKAELKALGAP